MRKREVLGFIGIIGLFLLAILVSADPDAVVDLNPKSVYETNELEYNLTVNNIGGSEVIEDISIDMQSFDITGMINYLGWDEFYNGSIIRWFNGDLENNVWALFRFDAKADLVSGDQNINVDIITKDDSGDQTTDTITITILDDTTAPVLSNNIPSDGGFLRENNPNQHITIDAIDPETGVLNVSFSYWNCSTNATNVTYTTLMLTCINNTCTDSIDVSGYEEGNNMCFEFVSFNNALESSRINGTVGFDGTPPQVFLISPPNSSFASNNTLFSFNATDNLAQTLSCDFIMDSSVIGSTIANNSEITSMSYSMQNLTEGIHSWTVSCSDSVGLNSTADSRQIILDLTAPNITLNSPENSSTIPDNTLIDISVTDNYDPSPNVTYSSSLNTSDLLEGINTLTVTAQDQAGNIAQKIFTFTIDKTDPVINLISPADNATNDVHLDITLNSTDNLADQLNCSLYLDGSINISQLINVSQVSNISTVLPISDYTWYIECFDDAGNSDTTAPRTIHIVDLTGPDISLDDIIYVARGEDYSFTATVTDPSGVSSVNSTFDSNPLNLTTSGDDYSGTIITDLSYSLGQYNLTITATDTLSNPSSLTDTFTLINGYNITLSLDPASSQPSKIVQVFGTVKLDNGSSVPESQITLNLPGQSVNVSIVSGSYSYNFTAPATDGTYPITASVTSSQGYTHSVSKDLTVGSGGAQSSQEPQQPSSSDSSSRSGSNIYCGDGVCTTASSAGENCQNCPQDCGICPVQKEDQVTDQPQKDDSSSFLVKDENLTVEESQEREPSGVGSATGIFNLGSLVTNVWAWLIFLALIAGLYYYAKEKKPGSKVNWEGYFR